MSRDEGLRQLARRAVEEFCAESGDGWYLVWAALGAGDLAARSRPSSGDEN